MNASASPAGTSNALISTTGSLMLPPLRLRTPSTLLAGRDAHGDLVGVVAAQRVYPERTARACLVDGLGERVLAACLGAVGGDDEVTAGEPCCRGRRSLDRVGDEQAGGVRQPDRGAAVPGDVRRLEAHAERQPHLDGAGFEG